MKRFSDVLKSMVVAGVVFVLASCGANPETLAKEKCKCEKMDNEAEKAKCIDNFLKKFDTLKDSDKEKYDKALAKCLK